MQKAKWAALAVISCLGAGATAVAAEPPLPLPLEQVVTLSPDWHWSGELAAGQALTISAGLAAPDALPPNSRVEVSWSGSPPAEPSADWSKHLHALDPDVYLAWRAPRAGTYRLTIRPSPAGAADAPSYHRDEGLAPLATQAPPNPAPAQAVELRVAIRSLERTAHRDIVIETEPNSTHMQAVEIPFDRGDRDQTIRVIGSADELEYFDNQGDGVSPDDWYRIVYRGSRPKMMLANLQLVEPTVSARIRVYQPGTPSPEDLAPREPLKRELFGNANPVPYVHPAAEVIGGSPPVYSYWEGRDINERIHQQDDNYRSFVTRTLEPGGVYYLRVEANQPGYELELRLRDPAPYSDPRQAVAQSIYYQLAEVDAWLIHRPRNIGLHQRVRDGSSLFGESCMSCHTQSGVWGVADALRHGYEPDGAVQNQRRLINTMYESLRPSIKLVDAAVNTSLAPNDLGDAPAGSRVAGRNVTLHERTFAPKKLHARQQRRTANYVLQTADPKGINAAGKGSNFGPNVVFKFAAEILERAWRDSGDPKYFWALEEKAHKVVETGEDRLKVTDDLGHRIEFFHDLFPAQNEYLEIVARLSDHDPQRIAEARRFYSDFEQRVAADLEHLLVLQQDNGGWGFDLGVSGEAGWSRLDEEPDAAPTGVALIALRAAGYGPEDRPVQRAVDWLLANQFDYGLWNRAAQTGFVTNAYVIRALSRLYPQEREARPRSDFEAEPGESLLEAISRTRALQATARADLADLMIEAAGSPHPEVRRYGYLGLGGVTVAKRGGPEIGDRAGIVEALVAGLGDPVKSCREAAFWSLRQFLLDDSGWSQAQAAYRAGDARTRQSLLQALVTRADLLAARSVMDPGELADLLAEAMQDSHPGVRAYAGKAAWRWWVWNPAMRERLNGAWVDRLSRAEPEAKAEAALRYSAASMLMVNGQIANQTGGKNVDQQYAELSELYEGIEARRATADAEQRRLLDRRLTAVAATHFQERGGDGGPGQLGYSTPGAARVVGDAVLAVYRGSPRPTTDAPGVPWRKIALEGAANIAHDDLQSTLLELLQTGDLDMVAVAARALSNPQALTLPAVPASLGPLLAKINAFLAAGRKEDAQGLANFLARVKWDFEGVEPEQERRFFELLLAGSDRADRASLLGRVLRGNRTLQRESVFEHVENAGGPEFWLPSTEWMLAFEQDAPDLEEAVEGAVEAEDLEVVELTFGRTTEQLVPDGLTSKNTILWWREGIPGAALSFAADAPEAGSYELIAAFLSDREGGIVQLELNGKPLGEPRDFYDADLTATGPVSLGVHSFEAGRNLLTVKMLGANPDAEPNYVFGLDYVKLEPDDGSGSLFTQDDQGVEVIDPIVAAKEHVVRHFIGWFDASRPQELRTTAVGLANKTAVRRNPDVRKTLAAYVDEEPLPQLKKSIQNILNSDDTVYGEQIRKLIVAGNATQQGSDVRPLEATPDWVKDVLYFRDYVFAELNKINDSDNRACISCHGVPGRVPTLYLNPPDAAGYIGPEELLANYRKMQQRVDAAEVERSKFLLKPLNIQTGEDDGHQGGVRYEKSDAGYRVIREWVLEQAELQRGGLVAGN